MMMMSQSIQKTVIVTTDTLTTMTMIRASRYGVKSSR